MCLPPLSSHLLKMQFLWKQPCLENVAVEGLEVVWVFFPEDI